jgi:hypothetical protein
VRGLVRPLLIVVLGLTIIAALVGCTPQPGPVLVNGRTLLTHPSAGASADALGYGVLATNRNGCMTMGKSVLVVPDGSGLSAEGSVTVLGKTYKLGSSIELGGGSGNAPTGSKCGSKSDYFWVG